PSSRTQVMSHHGRPMSVAAPLSVSDDQPLWMPLIIQTVATEGRGIEALIDAIHAHQAHLHLDGHLQRLEHRQLEIELQERLRDALLMRLLAHVSSQDMETLIERIQQRRLTPNQAVESMLAGLRFG
ncbi:MAG: hypothetical protein KC547_04495, partial [Anaerolineae bacterium]|nr:hypothetical protein [Anaerolineae bacterium]